MTYVHHKIANSATHLGGGASACLLDVNPSSNLNDGEKILMGGAYSSINGSNQ